MNRVRSDRPAGSAASHRCGPPRTLRTQSGASRCPSAVAGTTQPQRLRRRPAGASRAAAMTGCLLPRALHSRRSACPVSPRRPRVFRDAVGQPPEVALDDVAHRSAFQSVRWRQTAGDRGRGRPRYSDAITGHHQAGVRCTGRSNEHQHGVPAVPGAPGDCWGVSVEPSIGAGPAQPREFAPVLPGNLC
jgi:hypothetical protein